jgi:hypothetical protein
MYTGQEKESEKEGKEMREQRRLGNMIIRDRVFKVGDVIRWVPLYVSFEEQEARGLGIVTETETSGIKVKSYWTGDKKIREIDMLLERNNYTLQDYAPIPQVAEAIEMVRELGGVIEIGDYHLEQVL